VRVVRDAGPLIHLSWLHRLDLLPALFEEVLIPEAVRDEVLAAPDGTLGLDDIRAARERGLIDAVLPLVLELRRLGLWVSDALIDEVRTDEALRAPRRPGSTPPG
jgi:predicted nucleic acid-binding protein